MPTTPSTIIALDVGEKRIGVARARTDVRIAASLTTLINDENIWQTLEDLLGSEQPTTLVVGLPRGLEGQDTAQTRTTQGFIEKLQQHVGIPIHMQDEALTSVKAEQELEKRGKPYAKSDIDALAATYILEDYLSEREDA